MLVSHLSQQPQQKTRSAQSFYLSVGGETTVTQFTTAILQRVSSKCIRAGTADGRVYDCTSKVLCVLQATQTYDLASWRSPIAAKLPMSYAVCEHTLT